MSADTDIASLLGKDLRAEIIECIAYVQSQPIEVQRTVGRYVRDGAHRLRQALDKGVPARGVFSFPANEARATYALHSLVGEFRDYSYISGPLSHPQTGFSGSMEKCPDKRYCIHHCKLHGELASAIGNETLMDKILQSYSPAQLSAMWFGSNDVQLGYFGFIDNCKDVFARTVLSIRHKIIDDDCLWKELDIIQAARCGEKDIADVSAFYAQVPSVQKTLSELATVSRLERQDKIDCLGRRLMNLAYIKREFEYRAELVPMVKLVQKVCRAGTHVAREFERC